MQDPTKYPVGIQDFGEIIKGGYVYVDKTALMRQLVSKGKYYFLSRPRRFGKSLLLSTLAAYFEGKRKLFKGLAIAEETKKWPKHPVLYLDLSNEKYTESAVLEAVLNSKLKNWEEQYGSRADEVTLSLRFSGVIRRAFEQTKKQVVILIDEYDKPLLQSLDDEPLREDYRATLQAVYGNLKTCDKYIRFAMLTGVTRFSKLSVFSGLNNLDDISMNRRFATICGITERELEKYFGNGIEALAQEHGLSPEEAKQRLKRRYDGYLFAARSTERLYNPFSLLKALSEADFQDYWFATGTPTFLAEMLARERYDLGHLTSRSIAEARFNTLETLKSNPLPILYQSGYLTLDHRDEDGDYYLRFPNEEVERSFLQVLLPHYAHKREDDSDALLKSMVDHVRAGEPESFLRELQALLADTPYEKSEAGEIYFRNVLAIIFRLLGFYCEVEHALADGRSDIVIKTAQYIYVLELKVDQSAEKALRQIEEKEYAAPYAADKRKLFKIGVNFSGAKKKMDEWQVVAVEPAAS